MLSACKSTLSFLATVACSLFTPTAAQAANITLEGQYARDDSVQLFALNVAVTGSVDIRSYGYAGGVTSTGIFVASGGFDPILTLFDASGAFIADNDEGTGVAVDPSTGLAADARITINLAPGSYVVALTQFDNFSIGNLADGFAQTGNPNFTADPNFTPGGPCPNIVFRDVSGTPGMCRSGNWAVDFVNISSVTAVPEPATGVLLGAGLMGFYLFRSKRGAGLLFAGLLASFLSIPVKAQDPDYTNVGDILNGKRRLLAVEDLVISGYVPTNNPEIFPDLYTFNMQSANSQLSGGGVIDIGTFGVPANGFPSVTAHVFNTSRMTTVVIRSDQPSECVLYLPLEPYAPCDPGANGIAPFAGAVADFNQDGYDEVVIAGPSDGGNIIVIGTAANVNDSNNSPIFNYGPIAQADPLSQVITGDFNGDGQPEIAGLLKLPSGGLAVVIYSVDPGTLAVTKVAQIALQKAGTGTIAGLSITKGRFTPEAHDQIIVASTPNGVTATTLELIDFTPPSLVPQEQTAYVFKSGFLPSGGLIKVRTGKFGVPTNQYHQVVLMFAWYGNPRTNGAGANTKYVDVLNIDPVTLAWTSGSLYEFSNQDCGFDIAVGNFDHRQPDPLTPGATQPNLNDQIALVYGSCTNGAKTANIINVDPSTLAPSTASSTTLDSRLNGATLMSLTESDTQGRSMLLGEPTKITIQTLDQPTVIAAAPPMHIDFAKPLDGSPDANTFQVMNLSGMPGTYFTQFQIDNSSSTQSSHTGTTAMGWSVKESVDLKVQFGNPKTSPISASADVSFAATQSKKEIDTNGSNNFSSQTFDISVKTNGYDQVWYTENDFNLWIYPVLGKTTCPADQTCPPAAEVPLNIQFSAPNPQVLGSRAGNILAWYQPPWESGNIFSYPANYTQLQQAIPVALDKLSDDVSFSTDSLVETIKATWTAGSGTSTSTNSTRNYTEEGSITDSGKINILGNSAQLTGSITAGGSQSFSDLYTSDTKLAASTGVGINKPGGFANPGLYNYSVAPYILGQQKPPQGGDSNQPAIGINTYGTIRTVFTVDPTATTAGGWWQTMYGQTPDVAVNHPYRWIASRSLITSPVPRNCRVEGDAMTCYSSSTKTPADPTTSEFHWMRGFFITDATNAGQGPQVQLAHAGDKLSLQTRVYNYSLKEMDPSTTVHVRFYVQPWDSGSNLPLGPSSLIGESILSPIPQFDSAQGSPLNWVVAGTTFDTAAYQNQLLTFWVVVWMQDGNGKLVPDIEGHGLTSIPGTQVSSMADIQEEAYSNNVGFYNQKLQVLGAAGQVVTSSAGELPFAPEALSDSATGAGVTTTRPKRTAVGIGKISVSGSPAVAPGPSVKISATLQASSVETDRTTVFFYDGDPKAGGKEFGAEHVPYIPPQGSFTVGVPYRAPSCGVRQLFVVVNQGTSSEVVRRAAPIRIPCTAGLR